MKKLTFILAFTACAILSQAQIVKQLDVSVVSTDTTYYLPFDDRTSFTAFGITNQGTLIAVSMFSGISDQTGDLLTFRSKKNKGITLNEMAYLLIELGARDGIAGGGSGDTQQYIKDSGTWVSMPRFQPKRGQVDGLRGLGAILCILYYERP